MESKSLKDYILEELSQEQKDELAAIINDKNINPNSKFVINIIDDLAFIRINANIIDILEEKGIIDYVRPHLKELHESLKSIFYKNENEFVRGMMTSDKFINYIKDKNEPLCSILNGLGVKDSQKLIQNLFFKRFSGGYMSGYGEVLLSLLLSDYKAKDTTKGADIINLDGKQYEVKYANTDKEDSSFNLFDAKTNRNNQLGELRDYFEQYKDDRKNFKSLVSLFNEDIYNNSNNGNVKFLKPGWEFMINATKEYKKNGLLIFKGKDGSNLKIIVIDKEFNSIPEFKAFLRNNGIRLKKFRFSNNSPIIQFTVFDKNNKSNKFI